MTNKPEPNARPLPQLSELVERLREFAGEDGRLELPVIAEDGKIVGKRYITPEEMVLVDAHIDEAGTVWVPPTAWAYAQVCRVRNQLEAQLAQARADGDKLSEYAAHNGQCPRWHPSGPDCTCGLTQALTEWKDRA